MVGVVVAIAVVVGVVVRVAVGVAVVVAIAVVVVVVVVVMKTAQILRAGGWTNILGGSHWWTVTGSGIRVQDEKKLRRSVYQGTLARDVMLMYPNEIGAASGATGVAVPTIVATICNESGGLATVERYEPHLKDFSYGLMQPLTSTAAQVCRRVGVRASLRPKDADAWRRALAIPMLNVAVGATVHAINHFRLRLDRDPVLMYAAYNSGGIYPSTKNDWGLKSTTAAIDAFVRFYNDAVAVMA